MHAIPLDSQPFTNECWYKEVYRQHDLQQSTLHRAKHFNNIEKDSTLHKAIRQYFLQNTKHIDPNKNSRHDDEQHNSTNTDVKMNGFERIALCRKALDALDRRGWKRSFFQRKFHEQFIRATAKIFWKTEVQFIYRLITYKHKKLFTMKH